MSHDGDHNHVIVQVVRLIGQHLCDVGLRTSADVLMKEAGCRLVQPTAATFRHCVMKGDWTGAVNGKLKLVVLYYDCVSTAQIFKFVFLASRYQGCGILRLESSLRAGNSYFPLYILGHLDK